jgi:DNA invertase Pin-like site-specific DNA recombinase
MAPSLIPAAQYLRMSTEHQQYSLVNQATAIGRYAAEHDFLVVRTYSDAAKSGLRIKNRIGLKQLLKDVVDGGSAFRVILVYDVSRWGRFQDVDEAAHYEYLCKSSGIPVHYCAETFGGDSSMPCLIMKTLKRVMAGEYSRDLSLRVKAGLVHLVKLGYKVGGPPPYALRRMLLDPQGKAKYLLKTGERKCLTFDRVTLVPGPRKQIAVVQRIFREFADDHRSMRSIATRLNQDGIPFVRGSRWNVNLITHILNQLNYVGTQAWGRTISYLGSPKKWLPPEQWVRCANAFEPIISQELFDRAQATLANLTCRLTNEELLDRLKKVLKSEGRLTTAIIDHSPLCPGATTCRDRLGGLWNIYAQLGYHVPGVSSSLSSHQRAIQVRNDLFKNLLAQFPDQLEAVRLNRRCVPKLRYRKNGLLISVRTARFCPREGGVPHWRFKAHRVDRDRLTVLALLNEGNASVKQMLVLPNMNLPGKNFWVREDTEWLQGGVRVERMSDLLEAIRQVRECHERR